MSNQKHEGKNGVIECSVCLKEIPITGAKSVETTDYVAHFCGLECYDKWKKQQSDESKKEA
ncbi:MAG: hypothetical protein BMS9Abin36_1949 [Gammaproteobacteria bacterium]|nr:MAG: hypothetical protein BMS9Abin36_1949 [Gammaproteobacteria bacterium]